MFIFFSDKFSAGWSWTWQVKRAEFDKVLIEEVKRKGVAVRFNCTFTDVSCSRNEQLITYQSSEGKQVVVQSKYVIDASGYGRVLPRLFDLNIQSKLSPRGTIFTQVNDVNRTEKAGHNIFVHAFNNNTAWL